MKHILFIFFLFMTPTFIFSQQSLGKKYPGFIVKNDGEKIDGYIKQLSRIKSQERVVFFKDANDKDTKEVFNPQDLMGYRIADDTYLSIAYGHIDKNKKSFILRNSEGKIEEFLYFVERTEEGPELDIAQKGNVTTSIELDGRTELVAKGVWLKDRKEILDLSSPKMLLKFKKVMSEYVSDYPALAEKIAKKEKGYRLLNTAKILKEYNEYFSKK